MNSWDKMIITLLEMIKEHQDAPTWAMVIKLSEEVGELSEVMLHELGQLPHKADAEWKDTPIEEAADIMNVLLGILSTHYPDKTPEQLSNELLTAMVKKGEKYGRILGADPDLFI